MFEPNPNCPLGEIYSTVGEDPTWEALMEKQKAEKVKLMMRSVPVLDEGMILRHPRIW